MPDNDPAEQSPLSIADWQQLHAPVTSVSDQLVTRLKLMIHEGRLPVGSRLPPERDLADALQVSRSSLRQALHELELKRLVDRKPGRGTMVTSAGDDRFGEAFATKSTKQERTLRDVMDLRLSIEPPIAARAATRATATDVAHLDELTTEQASASRNRFAQLDAAFHLQLARSTGNPLLLSLLEVCSTWMDPVRRDRLQSKRRRELSLRGHREILDAVRDHDAISAEQAMHRHLSEVLDTVLEEVRTT